MPKIIYARLPLKSVVNGFYRCGLRFTKDWQSFAELDEATVARLKAEQMLEVVDAPPEGFVSDATAQDGLKPKLQNLDPEARQQAIITAIGSLAKDNAANFTSKGMPKTEALEVLLGFDISAAERDAAWALVQSAQNTQGEG